MKAGGFIEALVVITLVVIAIVVVLNIDWGAMPRWSDLFR